MLVIHSEQDFRVPLEQGIATFTALQRRGIESRLLTFPLPLLPARPDLR